MTTFFTADQHFGHTNIIKFEQANRRNQTGLLFRSVEEMDEYIIQQWNATVTPADTIYCLGDFSYKQTTMEAVLPRLNGAKILIVGNHDPFYKRLTMPLKTKMHMEAREDAARAGFTAIHLQLDIEIAGIGRVRMSHFPYWPRRPDMEEEYNLRNPEGRPAYGNEKMLMHGHIHSQWSAKNAEGFPLQMNVGVDMWKMRPASEAEVVAQYLKEFCL